MKTAALLFLAVQAAAVSVVGPFPVTREYPGELEGHISRRAVSASSWTNKGCVQDGSKLLLAKLAYSGNLNSPDYCVNLCSTQGYKYAGVEYGSQCVCGNTLDNGLGASLPASSCNMVCTGNSGLKCGGVWAMNLYEKPSSSLDRVGCYQDTSARVLSAASYQSTTMTPAACVAFCKGKNLALAGLEAGSECYCGAAVSGSPLDQSKCGTKCSGSSETCGGSWTIDVFRTGVVPPSTGSLGCFEDGTARVLPGMTQNVNTMTPQSCIAFCSTKNYKFAGVEAGTECWCGDTKPSKTATGCTMPCAGDKSKLCGGTWKLEVYDTGKGGAGGGTSNVANAAVTGVATPPSAAGSKYVWAHHMVGNTYSYKQANWATDISAAKAAGIDGFALNMGRDPWQPQSVDWAYAAAQAANFKLFFSFDMTSFGCANDADAATVAALIKKYANHPAQVKYQNKPLVSTFAGENCQFGTGATDKGWNLVRTKAGVSFFFLPSTFMTPAQIKTATWFDGQMNWDAAWPNNHQDPTVNRDNEWLAALGTRKYMASISPFFFTYYGPNSWNKNWIYRSDAWLLATRFEQLIQMRGKTDMLELLSWNDWGESHYVATIPPADWQPNSNGWTAGMPHTALLSLVKVYAQAFRTGSYAGWTDHVWLWSRPHPRAANPTAATNPRPNHWDWTDDNLYVVVTLAQPANVRIESGANYASWDLPAGLNKLRVASANGAIKATVTRNGQQVKKYDSTGVFTYTDKPKDYNYNYFVAEA